MFQGLRKVKQLRDIVFSKYFVPGLVLGLFSATLLLQVLISLPIALLFVIGDAFRWTEYGIVVGVFAVNSLVLTTIISSILIPLRGMLKSWVGKLSNLRMPF